MLKGTLTPEEFLRELRKEERGLSFPALIKPAEAPDTFLVSTQLTCDDWLEVPSSHIEGIEYVSSVPCESHEHPLVNVHLKEPDSAEGSFYASLASALARRGSTAARPRRAAGAPQGRPGPGRLPPGGHHLPLPLPCPGVGPGSGPDGPLVRVDEQACMLYRATATYLHTMAMLWEGAGYHEAAEVIDEWAYENDRRAIAAC